MSQDDRTTISLYFNEPWRTIVNKLTLDVTDDDDQGHLDTLEVAHANVSLHDVFASILQDLKPLREKFHSALECFYQCNHFMPTHTGTSAQLVSVHQDDVLKTPYLQTVNDMYCGSHIQATKDIVVNRDFRVLNQETVKQTAYRFIKQ